MCLVLWAKGRRGATCLEALVGAELRPAVVIVDPTIGDTVTDPVSEVAQSFSLPVIQPEEPNALDTIEYMKSLDPELFLLAGYGVILRRALLDVPRRGTINLHAGALPKYRGSSPLNWAIMNGDACVTLSVIRVDEGVDTGDVLMEKTIPITPCDTIVDVHAMANEEFPKMLVDTIRLVRVGKCTGRRQDETMAQYYPVRFPQDGYFLWDMCTAEQIHNRVRALRPPYPGARTFCQNREIVIVSSVLTTTPYYGEAGRVYRNDHRGILVGAQDKCLLVREAHFADDETSVADVVRRYECMATVRESALSYYMERAQVCA